MSIKNHTKVIVAPQITIYKNIFENSDELINLANREDSLLGGWLKWYSQGFRKGDPSYSDSKIDSRNNFVLREKELLKEYLDILKFIRDDYFSDFNKQNGIWPEFIKDWDTLVKNPDAYGIDIFRYDCNVPRGDDSKLMLEYHVDEFQLPSKNPTHRNVCTLNLYLNSNYSGGEICMYSSVTEKTYKYKPNAGDIVIMPSTIPFYHGVKNFHNADRYFMRSFFSYLVDAELETKNIEQIEEEDFIKNHLQTIKIFENEIEIN